MGTEKKLFHFLPRIDRGMKESACIGHLLCAGCFIEVVQYFSPYTHENIEAQRLVQDTYLVIRDAGFKVMST